MTVARDAADLVHAADVPRAHARSAAMPIAAHAARYRPDIDGLRAVAVASVIFYHAFPGVLPGGFLGVDVFFVISGYLITQLILKEMAERTFSLSEFYRRRVRRILPALLVVLAASALFGWFALLPDELVWLGRSIAWSAPFAANLFFARAGNYGGYFDPGAATSPLIHLWSLGVEEQFYLCWPLLLLLTGRARATGPALWAVIAISLVLSIWGGWVRPEQSFYLPTSRAWELAAGGILATARSGRIGATPVSTAVMSVAGLLLILLGAVFVAWAPPLSGLLGLTPPLGAVLLIAAGTQTVINRRVLSNRPMVFVGRISYPLYLWHWPALSFMRIIIGRSPTAAEATVAVIAAVIAAYATCRLVEEPIRFGRGKRRAVPVLLGALAAIAILGVGLASGRVGGRLVNPALMAWQIAMTDWRSPAPATKDHMWIFTAKSQRGKTALFIGDSHVQQYWPRARRVVTAHPRAARSAEFATYLGCPPLPDIEGWLRGSHCSATLKIALSLALHADVDTVVFGAFWEEYFMGQFAGPRPAWGTLSVYGRDDALRRRLTLDSPGTQRALDDFARVISRLTASGRRVYIVLSNPTSPSFDPLYLLPSADRLSLHLPDRISVEQGRRSVDARDFETYVAPLMARLRLIAARSGAIVIDPRGSLCAGMSCPATDARGLPVHMDSNHLTATFAREHATFIDAILLAPPVPGRGP